MKAWAMWLWNDPGSVARLLGGLTAAGSTVLASGVFPHDGLTWTAFAVAFLAGARGGNGSTKPAS